MAGYNILQTINFMSELNLWFILLFSDIFLFLIPLFTLYEWLFILLRGYFNLKYL